MSRELGWEYETPEGAGRIEFQMGNGLYTAEVR